MIDLHTHTYLSDGELGVAELAWRAEAAGCRILGIADHADGANMDFIVPRLVRAAAELSMAGGMRVVAGIELTYVPPKLLAKAIARARSLGAQYVVVHGETIVEPVPGGTNAAAIEGGADILAHPGLIAERDARHASRKGVLLEITTRKGHAYTNGHVLAVARSSGAKLVINSDTHGPDDLMGVEERAAVCRGAGMTAAEIRACLRNAAQLVARQCRGS